MSLDYTRIRALCFDVDGTLSDTDDQFVRKLATWARPIRFIFRDRDPLPWARKVVMFTETPGNIVFGLPDKLGIDGYFHSIGNFLYRLGLGRSNKSFWIITGVIDALEKLGATYKLSIVSARDHRSTLRFLRQFDIDKHFACIATAHTCRHTKPYPDPIFWAAEQMGVAPNECLMIGDTTVDIRAGKAANAQTVGVLSGFGEVEELQKFNADLILPSVAELVDFLMDNQPITTDDAFELSKT